MAITQLLANGRRDKFAVQKETRVRRRQFVSAVAVMYSTPKVTKNQIWERGANPVQRSRSGASRLVIAMRSVQWVQSEGVTALRSCSAVSAATSPDPIAEVKLVALEVGG